MTTEDPQRFLKALTAECEDEPRSDDHRAGLHQATGMVVVQRDTPESEDLVRLRAPAFATGHPADEVAADVVERRLRFDPD